MRKILSIIEITILVLGASYFLYRTNELDRNFQKEMRTMSSILSRYEKKAQWMDDIQPLILADSTLKIADISLIRILEATWEYCEKYDIPKDVFLSLIQRESQFNPGARGTDGEIGLCQVLPEIGVLIAQSYNLPIYSESDLFLIENNIEVAALFLKDLIRMYGMDRALAHYNHGRVGLGERGQRYAQDIVAEADKYVIY